MADPSLRPALTGAAATLSGIGLARFSYVPLFPIMVSAGWVDPAGAGLLGAVNLGGYLAGALAGRGVARRMGTAGALARDRRGAQQFGMGGGHGGVCDGASGNGVRPGRPLRPDGLA